MAFLIIFVIIIFAAMSIGVLISAVIILVPVLVSISLGDMMGLNWWQSLLAAFLTLAVAIVIEERYYAWHFKKHAAELGLPSDFIGWQIEIEGKIATILGSSGKKIMIRKKDAFFARRIDPHLARVKAGIYQDRPK